MVVFISFFFFYLILTDHQSSFVYNSLGDMHITYSQIGAIGCSKITREG